MYGFARGCAYLSITRTTCKIEMKAWPNLAPTHAKPEEVGSGDEYTLQ